MIEASGVRRSCDTEVSMAERSRSRSAPSRAWSMSAASVTRSIATAAWLPTASSRRRADEASSPPAPLDSTPITPIDDRLVRIGMNSQRPPGRVSVPRPVGRSASHDQRAAARSASLKSLSGGKAARSTSLPVSDGLFSGIRMAISALISRARWVTTIHSRSSRSITPAILRLKA